MPRSNPSSVGYARGTQVTTQITARETFGGPAKAGLGRHIGMGQFTYGAIINGNSGSGINGAPTLAGPSYPKVAGKILRDDLGRVIRDGPDGSFVRQATDLFGNPIYDEKGNKLFYPINFNNQIGGVSNPSSRYGPTRAPADGVNSNTRMRMAKSVAYWNRLNPARPMRGALNPSVAVWPPALPTGPPFPSIEQWEAAWDALGAVMGITIDDDASRSDAVEVVENHRPIGYDVTGSIINILYRMYQELDLPDIPEDYIASAIQNVLTNAIIRLNPLHISPSDPNIHKFNEILSNLILLNHFASNPQAPEYFSD